MAAKRQTDSRRRPSNARSSSAATRPSAGKLPATYKTFIDRFPALGHAHESVARAVDAAGPLDRKTCELIKVGICVGAGLESALRSHVRRAMQKGATQAEIEQAVLLGMNTVGFPRTVAAWQWALQQIERGV